MTCQDSFHEVAFNISFWTRNISSARILFWRGVRALLWDAQSSSIPISMVSKSPMRSSSDVKYLTSSHLTTVRAARESHPFSYPQQRDSSRVHYPHGHGGTCLSKITGNIQTDDLTALPLARKT